MEERRWKKRYTRIEYCINFSALSRPFDDENISLHTSIALTAFERREMGKLGALFSSFSWMEGAPKLGMSKTDPGLSALLPMREVFGVLAFRFKDAAVEGGLEDAGLIVNVADAG